jgi:hypothetical protein
MAKVRYRVRNWPEYNRALVNRYRLEIWLSEDVRQGWYATPTGDRGRPRVYSHLALTFCLTIRALFDLPLRGCQGLLESLLPRLDLDWAVPDYTVMCRRARSLEVKLPVRRRPGETVHLVVDSSGLKVYGEGEWKVRAHGWSKRRTWRKLHLGLDEATQEVLVARVTEAGVADSRMLVELLPEVEAPLAKVGGDGAYDREESWTAVAERRAEALFPPRRNARIWWHGNRDGPRLRRDEHLRRIRQVGRRRWKLESGYSRRSLAETAFGRLKSIFGDRLRSRVFGNQATEGLLKVRALNAMTALGLPDSYPVN